jgi:pimeloyl-ACP methyl ester carboxylesterase
MSLKGRAMPWFSSLLVEPIYRLMYGPLPQERGDSAVNGADANAPRSRGLVLIADGVGGLDLCGTGLRYVAGAERLPYDVDLFPWGHGFGRWYADLTDVANRDRQARLLAESIQRFRAAQPVDPAFLVAKSGGSGVVIKALELLDDESVETVVLLAPALSPGYDLTPALRAVRREVVVFWSPLDVFVLGAGTRVLGTADRVRTVAAGMVGFNIPAGSHHDPERDRQYAKLRQIRWRPRMAATGYLGGHVGPDSPMFLRRYVVPLLRVDALAQG